MPQYTIESFKINFSFTKHLSLSFSALQLVIVIVVHLSSHYLVYVHWFKSAYILKRKENMWNLFFYYKNWVHSYHLKWFLWCNFDHIDNIIRFLFSSSQQAMFYNKLILFSKLFQMPICSYSILFKSQASYVLKQIYFDFVVYTVQVLRFLHLVILK